MSTIRPTLLGLLRWSFRRIRRSVDRRPRTEKELADLEHYRMRADLEAEGQTVPPRSTPKTPICH